MLEDDWWRGAHHKRMLSEHAQQQHQAAKEWIEAKTFWLSFIVILTFILAAAGLSILVVTRHV